MEQFLESSFNNQFFQFANNFERHCKVIMFRLLSAESSEVREPSL